MSEMLHRIAHAIYKARREWQGLEDDWDSLLSGGKDIIVEEARGAIEAMREPTKASIRSEHHRRRAHLLASATGPCRTHGRRGDRRARPSSASLARPRSLLHRPTPHVSQEARNAARPSPPSISARCATGSQPRRRRARRTSLTTLRDST